MQWLVYLLQRPASAERRGMNSYIWLTPTGVLHRHRNFIVRQIHLTYNISPEGLLLRHSIITGTKYIT